MYTDLQHQRTLTGIQRAWVHPETPWAHAPRPHRWACRCDGHILPVRRTSRPPCCWWVPSVKPKFKIKKGNSSKLKQLWSQYPIYCPNFKKLFYRYRFPFVQNRQAKYFGNLDIIYPEHVIHQVHQAPEEKRWAIHCIFLWCFICESEKNEDILR